MERKRALKIATALAGPPLALAAGIACSGESGKNKPLPFLADTTTEAKVANSSPSPAVNQKNPNTEQVTNTDSFRLKEKVGDFNIGNIGGQSLNYQKDLAGRAVIIYYCCIGGSGDSAKIENLKKQYDESKLVVVNVVVPDSSKAGLPAPVLEEDSMAQDASFNKFRGQAYPYLVAIDKNGVWVDKRLGGNTISAGIEDLAQKLAIGQEFVPTVVNPSGVQTVAAESTTAIAEPKDAKINEARQTSLNFPLIKSNIALGPDVSVVTISDTFRQKTQNGEYIASVFEAVNDFNSIAASLRQAGSLEADEPKNYRQILDIMAGAGKQLADYYCTPQKPRITGQYWALAFDQVYATITYYKVQNYEKQGLLSAGYWREYSKSFNPICPILREDLSALQKQAGLPGGIGGE